MRLPWIPLVSLALFGCSENAVVTPDVPDASEELPEVDAAEQHEAEPPDATVEEADSSTQADVLVGPVGCVTDITPGARQIACDGIEYEVQVPPQCSAGGCGLILDIHGLTMCADQQDKNTALRASGMKHGYIVVQPTAPDGAIGPSWTPSTDDDRVWEFLLQVRQAWSVDPKRLHVTGFSQGGAMTWRMVCKHADMIASAAPIAAANATQLTAVVPPFTLDCPFTMYDSPCVELPLLHMHGTLDALVPFAKGQQQRDAVIDAWKLQKTETISSDAHHEHTRYLSANGTVYEFVSHDYVVTLPSLPVPIGGHCFPGGKDLNTDPMPGETLFFGCAPPNAFSWGEIVMQFFLDHPKL
ncbi:MAG: hypothetical protein HY898_14290 [Deltaproteobacteria bacterium]|nr:hypothetical protein [Deltaproteobacteria bacterium]